MTSKFTVFVHLPAQGEAVTARLFDMLALFYEMFGDEQYRHNSQFQNESAPRT